MRRTYRSPAVALTMLVGLLLSSMMLVPPAATAAPAQPWRDTTLSADQRARLLVDAMSFDQKMRIFNVNAADTGIPELGVPPRREIDGCCSVVVTDQPTTGLPGGLAVASTMEESSANAVGSVIGNEAWNLGYTSAASPTMDLSRSPWNGRQNEGFGEDPLVTGRLAASQINGVQDQDVYALVKHYLLNDQEARRSTVNEVVDERTLNELYARPWEIAVKTAEPGAIMCAFPKINGDYACGNDHTLNDILKGRLGFKGFVSSDFDALHSLQDYENGADVGSPSSFSGAALRQAVLDGVVSQTRFDDMVYRIVRTYFASGAFDNPAPGALDTPVPASQPLSSQLIEQHEAVARQVARKGAVLLKNTDSGLPLPKVDSIAVIGADADAYIAGSNGFSPIPARVTTMLDGITARAGSAVDVTYAPGTDPVRLGDTLPGLEPVPSDVLTPAGGAQGNGLLEQLFSNPNFAGAPAFVNKVDQVNVRNGLSSLIAINSSQVPGMQIPIALNPFSSWRYAGTLTAPATGTYELGLSLLGSAKLYVDDQLVVETDKDQYGTASAQVPMVAGTAYDIRIEYKPDAPNQFTGSLGDAPLGMLRFGWTPPTGTTVSGVQDAVTKAAAADVAVVVVRDYSGEMADRGTLTLPQAQDELIRQVARANTRTIVVMATGGPVLMPWLDDVDAVLEMWYPGEAGGKAAADLLFGDYSPQGKLPITFPASETQPNAIGISSSFSQVNTVNPTATHDEGVSIGYRAYADEGVEPLFPFGHGLTYSQFSYANMQVTGGADPTARVRVTNTGTKTATEVVQFYSGALGGAPVDTPSRQLIGWSSVRLLPGQSKWASISVDLTGPEHPMSYFDVAASAWVVPAGTTTIYAGSSATDTRTTGTMTLGGGATTPVGTPVIAGDMRVGSIATCTPAADGTALAYEWLSNGSAIAGQTTGRLTLTPNLLGTAIACRVTSTEVGGGTATSTTRVVGLGAALAPAGKTRLKGKAVVGRTLKVKPFAWLPAATTTTYVWKVGKRTVSTSEKYKVKRRDRGKKIRVVVTASSPGHADGTVTLTKRVKRG